MLKYKFSLLIILLLIGFTDCFTCKRQVKPSILEGNVIDPNETIPKLSIPYSVSVKGNNEEPGKVFDYCMGTWSYSYDLTDNSVQYLKYILKKNNVNLLDNGEKKIVLHVTNAECINTGVFNVVIKLKVNIDDKIHKNFEGKSNTSNLWWMGWALETDVKDAVNKMLNDKEILNYLQGKK